MTPAMRVATWRPARPCCCTMPYTITTKAPVGPLDRHGKPIPKPSLQRVLRRTAIFAPLIALFLFVFPTDEDLTVLGLVFNVALLLAFFMPFSYVVDVVVYRMLWRRYEKERAAKRAR